jgi:hypothetical protein
MKHIHSIDLIKYGFTITLLLFLGLLAAVATIENCWRKKERSEELDEDFSTNEHVREEDEGETP